MSGQSFQQDLINFIGHRILVGIKEIKPKLGVTGSRDEESCAEQEAVYLIGLADGLALAQLLSVGKQGDGNCFKASDLLLEE